MSTSIFCHQHPEIFSNFKSPTSKCHRHHNITNITVTLLRSEPVHAKSSSCFKLVIRRDFSRNRSIEFNLLISNSNGIKTIKTSYTSNLWILLFRLYDSEHYSPEYSGKILSWCYKPNKTIFTARDHGNNGCQ